MQYVYLLQNHHVPNLVKFGFTTRHPDSRALEISSATGVPGDWNVIHYWEVVDGYAVEQRVFKHLKQYRLDRQEFFKLTPRVAIQKISEAIDECGIDPIAKEAELRAEVERLRVTEAARVATLWKEVNENVQKEGVRKESIRNEIIAEQKELRGNKSILDTVVFTIVYAALSYGVYRFNLKDDGGDVMKAVKSTAGCVFVLTLLPVFPAISFCFTSFVSDLFFEDALSEKEAKVLKKYNVKSAAELY